MQVEMDLQTRERMGHLHPFDSSRPCAMYCFCRDGLQRLLPSAWTISLDTKLYIPPTFHFFRALASSSS
jgi:hypothetical protein